MKTPSYPYTRMLILAASLSLVGQVTAIAFMLWTNPYTTFVFMTFGAGMILLGMSVFGFAMFKEIKARAESLMERTFQAGEYVFHQGDVGDRIYIVKSGEVEVVREDPEKGEAIVARLGEGEFFGEMALLSDAPRNASIRAAKNVTTLSIARQDFYSLYSSIPAFQESILAAMARRK